MLSLAYIIRMEQNRVALWGAGAHSSSKVMTWKADALRVSGGLVYFQSHQLVISFAFMLVAPQS